jgi:MoxR-like ATPase
VALVAFETGMELTRDEVLRGLAATGYVADPQLATAIALMRRLERPLLLEGEAGVGKTEVAKALAAMLGRPLIRLQCYEGLDANAAVYEWNYQRQLLAIKIRETEELSAEAKEAHIFEPDFLLERPLLKAIQAPEPVVLLIDEIDRADEEFEAYLLEVLSDFQISIPELGTITATSIPWVVLTSNRTRRSSGVTTASVASADSGRSGSARSSARFDVKWQWMSTVTGWRCARRAISVSASWAPASSPPPASSP